MSKHPDAMEGVQHYVERLGTVEAIRYDGTNHEQIDKWLDSLPNAPQTRFEDDEFSLDTGERNPVWTPVDKGDVVLRDQRGQFFVYTGEDFDESYQLADDGGEDDDDDDDGGGEEPLAYPPINGDATDNETINSTPGHTNAEAVA